MLADLSAVGRNLFKAMFSDEPLPDVEAAIVVAHPGDESMSASWLMVRLQERASVFCLTKAATERPQAARLAGVPAGNCHNLGVPEDELAADLEHLVWLTTAAVTSLQPRVLVTHACEGQNLNHDATAFAVHMTARLLTRAGGAAPLVVEFPRSSNPETSSEDCLASLARQAVRVEFGPESRKVKRRMLQCHGDGHLTLDRAMFQSESSIFSRRQAVHWTRWAACLARTLTPPGARSTTSSATRARSPGCSIAQCCRLLHERSGVVRRLGGVAVLTQQRSTSATLHACATQPRGVYGSSASKISLIDPTHASSRCGRKPCRNRRASCGRSGLALNPGVDEGADQPAPTPCPGGTRHRALAGRRRTSACNPDARDRASAGRPASAAAARPRRGPPPSATASSTG